MADSKHHSFELNEAEVCFGIVGNIPKEFHSADLRTMFSNFIDDNDESGGFKCFHFRHRPEFRQEQASTGGDKDTQVSATTCCVILVRKEKLQELIKSYHGKNWVDRKGKYFPSKAIISKIRVKAGKGLYVFGGVTAEYSATSVRNLPCKAARKISNLFDIFCLARQIPHLCGNHENLAEPGQSIIQ